MTGMLNEKLLHLPGIWAASGVADMAEWDPGLLLFMLFFLLASIAMVIAGLILFAIVAGILMLLTGIGITWVSVLAGWYHRSVSKGVSTFFHLCFAGMGIVVALLLLLVLDTFQVSAVSNTSFCLCIVAASATAGWVCFSIIKKLAQWLYEKWMMRNN